MITLASANVEDVKPETTSQQVDEYVRERLRKEVAEGPRGTAARIAERLDIAPAHLSNIISPQPTRNPGEKVTRACAAYWGISLSTLEALARGETPAPHLHLVPGGDVRSRALRALQELHTEDPDLAAYVRHAVMQERQKALEGWTAHELLVQLEADFASWKRAHNQGEESSTVRELFGEKAQVREDTSDGRPPFKRGPKKP